LHFWAALFGIAITSQSIAAQISVPSGDWWFGYQNQLGTTARNCRAQEISYPLGIP